MIFITKRKSKLELLKKKYQSLMHKSFEKALNDVNQSDAIQQEALKVLQNIKALESAH